MPATLDRGAILHHAGLHRLSPALRDGAPALVPPGEGVGGRCGWESFFRALDGRGLAVAIEAEDPAVRFVPRAEARSPASGRSALAEARRFLRALAGKL
jgi:sugar phosphate isomerase/epimerase